VAKVTDSYDIDNGAANLIEEERGKGFILPITNSSPDFDVWRGRVAVSCWVPNKIINPHAKRAAIYMAVSEQITRLTIGHTLTGGNLLPNSSVPVSDIFPA
jgi:hypothetical protein